MKAVLNNTPEGIQSYVWSGEQSPYIDTINAHQIAHITVGCLGGCSPAEAIKNEDALMVLHSEEGGWTFVALMDAHHSSESAEFILTLLEAHQASIITTLSLPVSQSLHTIQRFFLDLFNSQTTKASLRKVHGETSLLLCVQQRQYVWWLSIGDNLIYLLHPELAHFGQYKLNQRQFFEWIGQQNTFELEVPCYSTGIRELRGGTNQIVLLTDGVLESGTRPFENDRYLYQFFDMESETDTTSNSVQQILNTVMAENGKDSATLISWRVENSFSSGLLPSN